ncbi:UNVERIFIED_CONTAM: Homeobox-leucine zipper protein ROC2 [Sesamum calycinum]|uniref:Homeobox-leucine zipper protein ROC2 n=1 Tax=Sesamum calycinum TaxID=2727403 RepID=A0AAW2Q3J4_9LAMI
MVGKQHFGVNSNISEDDEIQRRVHEEINKSSSENEDANSTENQLLKRKRYHRHTAHQIQEMEAFFKDCPHPNNRQRKEISQELGMEPLQVKFWFQNKRTQMKIDRISSIAAKYVGKPFAKSDDIPSSSIPHPMDPGVAASG